MIILDTNVLSELMTEQADQSVLNWFNQQKISELFTTSVNVYELQFGIQRLTGGKRKRELEAAFANLFSTDFQSKILPMDFAAAVEAATLDAYQTSKGQRIDMADILIASIALDKGASLATRNVRHFAQTKVPIINPWDF